MKGSKLLKVSSILMIISGACGLFFSVLMIATGSVIFGLLGIAGIGAVLTTVVIIDTLAWSVLELIAGIFGAKNSSNPAQAKKCMAFAIVIIALYFFINFLTYGYDDGFLFALFSIVLSLIIPTLYLVGAVKLDKNG